MTAPRFLLCLALICGLTCLSTRALAEGIEDTPENRWTQVKRYNEAVPPEDMFADMADKMSVNVPEEQRGRFIALMTEHLDIEALTKAMNEAMVKHFTAAELKALADFYGTKEGKSAMGKMGVYMAEVMPAIQTEIMRAQMKANGALE